MKARKQTWILTLLLASAPAMLWLSQARHASSQARRGTACPAAASERQVCFAGKAARGNYQEIIDDIETTEIGLASYEKYFLGIAYFGLSGRTGAASLRCFQTAQAKGQLESFLENRQEMMRDLGSLGNADALKYTYIAARVLESARQVTGCDESGEPLSGLASHARAYLSRAIEDLFFYYGSAGGEQTPGRRAFDGQMDALQEIIQGFVGTVSRMETSHDLTQIEIDVARRDLGALAKQLNDAWKPQGAGPEAAGDVVLETPDPQTGIARLSYGPGMSRALAQIGARRRELTLLAGEGGAIGDARAVIDRFVRESGATGMKDYQERRGRTVADAQRLAVGFAAVANDARRIVDSAAASRLSTPAPPRADGLEERWSAIAQQWRTVKPECNVFPDKWYCR